ncbi:MAG: NAD(P)-dependent oxidoreductase [Bacilli bacterium]|nr:NAD(P)-dependent oxidoreductase [Bacilli bacterium]
MKKILVTGAGGSLGELTIKQLLKLEDVQITALDLRTKRYHKKIKKYHKDINIVYGDINDYNLISELVKDNDYIIHLAGVMPPLANLKVNLLKDIDYKGTENIIKAISYYNPDCFLVYPSTTSIYEKNENNLYNTKSYLKVDEDDYYSEYKLKIENLIIKKVKNYVIYRLPIVLCIEGEFIYNVNRKDNVEVITDRDVANALAVSIKDCKKINKQVFNLSDGEENRIMYRDLLIKILKSYGVNMHYIYSLIFLEKNYNVGFYSDTDKLIKKLKFKDDNIDLYFIRLKRRSKKRLIQKILAKPIIYYLNIKYNNKRVG